MPGKEKKRKIKLKKRNIFLAKKPAITIHARVVKNHVGTLGNWEHP